MTLKDLLASTNTSLGSCFGMIVLSTFVWGCRF
jgi:hypothetical protein